MGQMQQRIKDVTQTTRLLPATPAVQKTIESGTASSEEAISKAVKASRKTQFSKLTAF